MSQPMPGLVPGMIGNIAEPPAASRLNREDHVMSWKPEVIADNTGNWVGNGLRFATQAEAQQNASDLAMRWTSVRDFRATESTDPVNYSYVDRRLVAVEPTWKKNAIAATRGTQLGAIIACALGVEVPHPCFVGKATLTSDNFIICNFIDKDGESHMGAFVGSSSDLVRNARGLAEHLKLNDEEKKALFAALHGWAAVRDLEVA